MRAFVALEVPPIPPPVPAGLRPEDHLTLHFFEELPLERVPAVVEAMGEVAAVSPPFELEVRGVGAFPALHRPRVVWAGIGDGAPSVQSVGDRVRQALSARGFPTENRPFIPHLTLARIRSAGQAAAAHRFLVDPENAGRVWVRTMVTEILLQESELFPTGARHTVRARVSLGSVPPPPPGASSTSGGPAPAPPARRRTD
jgi:RNA 2',3'-cyclic 3'-phosphodiesterase